MYLQSMYPYTYAYAYATPAPPCRGELQTGLRC